MEAFAEMAGVELVVIDEDTRAARFQERASLERSALQLSSTSDSG